MYYCEHCGTKNQSDSKFCESCGSRNVTHETPRRIHTGTGNTNSKRKLGWYFALSPLMIPAMVLAYAMLYTVTSLIRTTSADDSSLGILIIRIVNYILGLVGLLGVISVFTLMPIGIYLLVKYKKAENVIHLNNAAPEQIKKWNWGAFLLTWIWGISNHTYISLLCLIPYVGIVMAFVLGAKGNEWAWENKEWDSIEQFQRVQKKWAQWGIGLIGGLIVLALIAVITLVAIHPSGSSRTVDNQHSPDVTSTVAPESVLPSRPISQLLPANIISSNNSSAIAASVVNVMCFDTNNKNPLESGLYGSGTILTHDGLVITNSHVISVVPDITTVGCVVVLPDASTGSPSDIYNAQPIKFTGLSDQYDLAFLSINSAFTGTDGISHGIYPRNFPTFDDSGTCGQNSVELGESVRVYGYPGSVGHSQLTVTEGIVSSILNDQGMIITSAKIDSGNSGGLAVDGNGCMVGIPSAVTLGNYENLGIIISMDAINEFIDKISKKTEVTQPQQDTSLLDSDGDGITNVDETKLGTDPYNKDTDGDGFDDGTELKSGHDPLSPAI